MSRCDFETVVQGRFAYVTLRGEFDMLACGALEPELERVADLPDVDVVTVDLRGLEFLDSHGLRALLFARDRLEEFDRQLVLVRGSSEVQRVFEITRTTDQLEFVDSP
ncbi:MAG TPA: STAS domain-containing protein [Solirubrobacter sp.]|jgi:anti-anti-sigma factor|nr:STAS domain-containing protein [Solirubrobacter sp.]